MGPETDAADDGRPWQRPVASRRWCSNRSLGQRRRVGVAVVAMALGEGGCGWTG